MDIKVVRRGFDKDDEKWFSKENIDKLRIAQEEIVWLLDRGYRMESVIELVSNKNRFSKKQRMALVRSTASSSKCEGREKKRLSHKDIENHEIHIDGFNIIITLEVALSNSCNFLGNDGVIRDLAGLRGTYKIVDKTYKALELIGKELDHLGVKKAVFYLDQPVSNSGRLKELIYEISKDWRCNVEVDIVRNPDVLLMNMERIVSADEVILDNCKSWFNLSRNIIDRCIENKTIINLDK